MPAINICDYLAVARYNAGINFKTERGGVGETGKAAAFEFFCNFLVKLLDPWDWKIVQI